MNEIKGRLTIHKPGINCKQILVIYKNCWKEISRSNYKRVFDEITADLGGTRWEFDKIDK